MLFGASTFADELQTTFGVLDDLFEADESSRGFGCRYAVAADVGDDAFGAFPRQRRPGVVTRRLHGDLDFGSRSAGVTSSRLGFALQDLHAVGVVVEQRAVVVGVGGRATPGLGGSDAFAKRRHRLVLLDEQFV